MIVSDMWFCVMFFYDLVFLVGVIIIVRYLDYGYKIEEYENLICKK